MIRFQFFIILKKLVGQSLSAFIAASFQHSSACRRCHSLTEAVYFALLSLFGLIRSLHNSFSCIWFLSFSFLIPAPVLRDNFLIISQKDKPRQAILPAFSFLCGKLCLFFGFFLNFVLNFGFRLTASERLWRKLRKTAFCFCASDMRGLTPLRPFLRGE